MDGSFWLEPPPPPKRMPKYWRDREPRLRHTTRLLLPAGLPGLHDVWEEWTYFLVLELLQRGHHELECLGLFERKGDASPEHTAAFASLEPAPKDGP